MNAATEMPRYRCHKTVWALEIDTIQWDITTQKGGWIVTPLDRGYGNITLPPEVFSRYTPSAGDFIVQYDDSYWSVSPRKTFIEGYTPIAASDVNPINATGWLDQRSLPDHAVQELRRWAVGMANNGRDVDSAVEVAAKFEAYVLSGAPAKTDPGDDQ